MPLMHFEGYDLVSRLGKGAYGTVYKAQKTGNTELVAIKILWDGGLDDLEKAIQRNQPQKVSEDHLRRFKEEDEILRSLRRFSQRSLGKAYVPLIKSASFARDNEIQWSYLVMEFVDKPSIEDHLKIAREKRLQPLITEAVALEITKRFMQLLSHLHSRELYLIDAQFKNFRLGTIPETANFDALDLMILDWNGTETFDEGRKRNFKHPASYDIRSAIAFLFNMLTGTSVFREQALSPRAIMQMAGSTWNQISPGTRQICLKVLSQTAGQFSRPTVEDVINHIERSQLRWRNNAEDIPINENEAERYTASDLLDGEWFAERRGNTDRKNGFQILREKGYFGRGERYRNAVRFFMSRQINKALREYDPEVRESNLSREDLRWHLALHTLNHIDGFLLDAIATDLQKALLAYPDEYSEDVATWERYKNILDEIAKNYADAPDNATLIQLLLDEASVMIDWLSVTSDQIRLVDAYRELPETENDQYYLSLLQKAKSFQQRLANWTEREPKSIYRRLTLHDLFQLTWNDSLSEVPEPPSHQLDSLITKLQSKVNELAELKGRYDKLRDLANRGEIAKLRNEFPQTSRPTSGLWVTLLNDVITALAQSSNVDNEEIVEFAKDYREYLYADTRELVQKRELALKQEGIREELRNAATAEAVAAGLREAHELGVITSESLQGDMTSLLKVWQDYEERRPAELKRLKRSEKRRLLGSLREIKIRLAPVTASLGDIEVGLVKNIALRHMEDLRELSGSHRFRYLLLN